MRKLLPFAVLASFLAPPLQAAPQTSIYRHLCFTYDQCRERFRAAADKTAKATENSKVGSLAVPSERDKDLTIDYLYVPPTVRAERLVVMSSGVHGVEGFAGSAIQHQFLEEQFGEVDRATTGVLLIHSVNPYGMKYLRRVSEHNIDLNRNFDIDEKIFETKNEGYKKLSTILNPEGKVTRGFLSYANFYYRIGRLLLVESLATLREATLKGQYDLARGLYFGGKTFEPQRDLLQPLVLEIAAPYKKALLLDLHTGYGDRGVLHLFPNPPEDDESKKAMEAIFAGWKIDAGGTGDFYESTGDFSTYLYRLLKKEGKLAVPMVLEFGTVNNTGYRGSIESLRRMIAENQLTQFTADTPSTEKRIKEEFMEMYFPTAKEWKEKVLGISQKAVPQFLNQFEAYN